MFICACGCGTHVYSTRTGPGHGAAYSLPDGVYGSAASSGWCAVPGLEAGGRGRGDVRSPAPACVRREVVRRPAAPAELVSGLDHGDVGRSVAMWPSIGTPPCRPERAGP